MSYAYGLERLVHAVQELSLARDLDAVAQVVRHAARELTGADGATFVLRDGDQCYYRDEEAIAPLWKGQRFPLDRCVTGWAMQHRCPVVIEDIYADARIPHDAYRPTFVRSLAVVPIRTLDPIGAIGNYWAAAHRATADEVHLLQALADSASVALENVQVYAELEQRVRQRTKQLRAEIVERGRIEQEVRRLSLTDELTGLYNRRGFFELAEAALAAPSSTRYRLFYADLDGLKHCNDAHGHACGDAMIVAAARALQAVFRKTDIIARVGGDEFVALARDGDEDAAVLAARLEQALAARSSEVRVTMSVGDIVIANGNRDLDHLIARADERMYAMKLGRRGHIAAA